MTPANPEDVLDDITLLRRYAEEGSEVAFTTLVERHLGLVYEAALRQLQGAEHRAQDVAQSVFVDLARHAAALTGRQEILGWLYTSTHYAAAKLKRTEQRRTQREQEAHAMHELNSPAPAPDWDRLRPVLDDALLALPEPDRAVILLRFFQQRRFADLGRQLGLSENTARMRLDRALEKLRAALGQRGITSTAAGLGLVLASQPAVALPASLAATVAGAALAGASAGGGAVAAATFFMTAKTTLTTAAAALALGFAGYEFSQRRAAEAERTAAKAELAALGRERDSLRARLGTEEQRAAETERKNAGLQQELETTRARPTTTAAADAEMKALLDRVAELKRRIAEVPGARARAAGILKREDWVKIAFDNRLETEADVKRALRDIQDQVKVTWASLVQGALRDFAAANSGLLPTDCAQLAPFLPVGTDPAILSQFQMLRTGNLSDVPDQAWLVADLGPVEDEEEAVVLFGRGDMLTGSNDGVRRAALRAYTEFMRTHNGQFPAEAMQLQPYLRQPIAPKQLQDFWRKHAHQLR